MAKTAAKSSAPKKTSASPKTKATAPQSGTDKVGQLSEDVLQKLKDLDMDAQLQRDLEWCLGSYRSDNNPVGLYEMLERAQGFLIIEKEKKTKGVTSKLIDEIEKVLKDR